MKLLVDNLPYDKTSPASIECYGARMVGKTFRQIYDQSPTASNYGNPHRKGGLGNLVEECHFFFKANSDADPDIPDAGVEIKSTPLEYGKSDSGVKAGERLVLTMIPHDAPVEFFFEDSHLWRKCHLLLLVVYYRNKAIVDRLNYLIKYVRLFTPSSTDLEIIHEDYLFIIDMIRRGRAHELSESQTHYLGACTKGATAAGSVKSQYYPCESDNEIHTAKRRAFCYKKPYMTHVINDCIMESPQTHRQSVSDSIVTNERQLFGTSFEEFVLNEVRPYVGMSCSRIAEQMGLDYDKADPPKNFWSIVALRMLKVRTANAAEFEKAGIEVKTIRLESNNAMEQSMSFETLNLCRLASDDWENSQIYEKFAETRFLLVVFKRQGNDYVFKGMQFWSMPYSVLEGAVFRGWQKIHRVLNAGVVLKKSSRYTKRGNPYVTNNLPGKSENPVIHLRPHSRFAYYKLRDGTEIGNRSHGDLLPNGEWMTKQCVWLNNDFVVQQLDETLKR